MLLSHECTYCKAERDEGEGGVNGVNGVNRAWAYFFAEFFFFFFFSLALSTILETGQSARRYEAKHMPSQQKLRACHGGGKEVQLRDRYGGGKDEPLSFVF